MPYSAKLHHLHRVNCEEFFVLLEVIFEQETSDYREWEQCCNGAESFLLFVYITCEYCTVIVLQD